MKILIILFSLLLITISCYSQCGTYNVTLAQNSDGSFMQDAVLQATLVGGSTAQRYTWSSPNGNTYNNKTLITNARPGQFCVFSYDSINICYDTACIAATDTLNCAYMLPRIYENDSCLYNDVILSTSVKTGSGKYSYLWNTGNTTSFLQGRTTGIYSVLIKDSVYGCMQTIIDTVVDDTCNPCVNFNFSIWKNDSCKSNNIKLSAQNLFFNLPNIKYQWNTGSSSSFVSGLSSGTYIVTVTDTIYGCKDTLTINAVDSVYRCCSAHFYNYDSFWGGATKSFTSLASSQQGVITSRNWSFGNGNSGTGINVSHTFALGGSYTVCHYIEDALNCKDTSCKTVTAPPPGKNLRVYKYGDPYILSRDRWINFEYHNIGTTTENCTIEYRYPAGCSLTYSSLTPTSNSGNKLTFNLGTLNPGTYGWVTIKMSSPSSFVIGSTKCDTTYILSFLNDVDTTNNISYTCQNVYSSYDPNDKIPSPLGLTDKGLIDTSTKEISYLINFQNEGNFRTYKVRVEDVIDPSFDINTIMIGDVSHTYRMVVSGNKITWNFDTINLAPKLIDEPKSKGYIQYSIKLKPNLPIGTKIKNHAEIYFDNNLPIYTDTTINTLYVPVLCDTPINSFNILTTATKTAQVQYTGSTIDTVTYLWGDGQKSIAAAPSTQITSHIYTTTADSVKISSIIKNKCGKADTVSKWYQFCKSTINFQTKSFCDTNIKLTLSTDTNYVFQNWSDGSTSNPKTVTSVQKITAIYLQKNGCSYRDSFDIKKNTSPTLQKATKYLNCIKTPIPLTVFNSDATAYLWSTGQTTSVLNISTKGIYTVVITHPCGSFRDTFKILDTASSIIDTQRKITCSTYVWRDSTYTKSGKYTRLFKSASGCDSLITLDLSIGLDPKLILTGGINYSLRDTYKTYQWYLCSLWKKITNETKKTFTTTTRGSYAVIVSNGVCTDTSDCVVLYSQSSSLGKGNPNTGISIYPNPAKDKLNIDFDQFYPSTKLRIYDMLGKLMYSADYRQIDKLQLEVDKFPKGIYSLHLAQDNEIHNFKFVKE
jgi:hypothetical protein